jgi:hypothetical protein
MVLGEGLALSGLNLDESRRPISLLTLISSSCAARTPPGAFVTQHGERLSPSPQGQAEPAPEWLVNMGAPRRSAHVSPPPSLRLTFPTRKHSAKPLVTGGAGFATPTPTRDGVTPCWQQRGAPRAPAAPWTTPRPPHGRDRN